MNFKLTPLTINDRPHMERVVALTQLGGHTPLASWSFPSHFIWREIFSYAWTELNGWWCLFAEYEDGIFMPLPPLGPSAWVGSGSPCPLKDVLVQVMDFMKTRNGSSGVTRIENIPEEQKEELQRLGYRLGSKDADYLYLTQDLVSLKGDRFKSPRAAYNRFLRAHRVRYSPYRVPDRDACLTLLQRWMAQKEETPFSFSNQVDSVAHAMLRDSASAHRTALYHYEALGLVGRVAWVNGMIRGYTFGFERSSDVFCVLFEVTDRTIYGLAQFLFREFCRELKKYPYINTMDDSGLPSLAKSKRAYHPFRMVANYIASP